MHLSCGSTELCPWLSRVKRPGCRVEDVRGEGAQVSLEKQVGAVVQGRATGVSVPGECVQGSRLHTPRERLRGVSLCGALPPWGFFCTRQRTAVPGVKFTGSVFKSGRGC